MIDCLALRDMTETEVWEMEDRQVFDVSFSDGVIPMRTKQVQLSWYYWRMYRENPSVPMLKGHVTPYGKWVSGAHFALGEDLLFSIFGRVPGISIWDLARCFCLVANDIYNMHILELSEWITTGSLYDLAEILNHPKVTSIKEGFLERADDCGWNNFIIEQDLVTTNDAIKEVLYGDNEDLKNNQIQKMCSVDILSKGQIGQMVGFRGYVNDSDGTVFSRPLDESYGEGLFTNYALLTESRSATRALDNNTKPLEDSEYFNRRMQSVSSVVRAVEGDSCTGFKTNPWLVEEGDLMLLRGKNHMVDDKPVMIWGGIDDLIGKLIQIRTITGCGNHDSQTTCSTCLGFSTVLVPPETNLGYYLSSTLCGPISQLTLSTKHYEASLIAIKLYLNEFASKYFRIFATKPSEVYLTKPTCNRNPIIAIPTEFVKNLTLINTVPVDQLAPANISNCGWVEIANTDKNGDPLSFELVELSVAGVGSSLTTQALKYLKENGWKTNGKSIEISLTGWDHTVPFFSVPYRGDNVSDLLNEVVHFMIPSKDASKKITNYNTPSAAIFDLVSILTKKLNINMIQAEIFVRSCMAKDPDNGDYRLPVAGEDFKFTSAHLCNMYRNLTGALAYQEQYTVLTSTEWYESKPRPTHLLDAIVIPKRI